jgi:regulator of RNase E activity RraA
MKKHTLLKPVAGAVAALLVFPLLGQEKRPEITDEELRQGAELLLYELPEDQDPEALVKEYEGLRVTDVLDAMQALGMQDTGIMDKSIRPLWRDHTPELGHRFYGVAITYRYLPTNRPKPDNMKYEDFRKWHGHWYQTYAPELFSRIVRPGTVVVIDAHGVENTGFVGSNNGYSWISKGAEGIVTNGNCRDTDELIIQRVPVYSKYQGGGTRPGRIEAGAINVPVTVGGVMVRPGDMVVADGDGVVVVPHEYVDRVAEIAWDIAGSDKAGRRRIYEKMGRELDETVK